jgi:hypothetical protein
VASIEGRAVRLPHVQQFERRLVSSQCLSVSVSQCGVAVVVGVGAGVGSVTVLEDDIMSLCRCVVVFFALPHMLTF